MQREPGNLVLRHSVSIKVLSFPILYWILEALHVECWNSTLRFASLPEWGNENISLPRVESSPQPAAFTVALLFPWSLEWPQCSDKCFGDKKYINGIIIIRPKACPTSGLSWRRTAVISACRVVWGGSQWHKVCLWTQLVVGSIPTGEKKIFISIYISISSLWRRGKARRWVPLLNTQSVLTLMQREA